MQSLLSKLLILDHDVILDAGEKVLSQGTLWQSDPAKYESNIHQLISFFKIYADEFHHRKEEDILFPAIQKKNELSGNGIIQELLEQHESFREIMHNIHIALEAKEYTKVEINLSEYINDLRDHIAIENDELFPMAEAMFSEDELEKLYHNCIDNERTLGISRKESLEHFIKNFN